MLLKWVSFVRKSFCRDFLFFYFEDQNERIFTPNVVIIQWNEYIERIHQMSYSSLSDNGMLQIFSFWIKWLYGTLLNCSRIFMAIYLFSQILKFTKYSIKPIEKLSRRHLINSSDVFLLRVSLYKNPGKNIFALNNPLQWYRYCWEEKKFP